MENKNNIDIQTTIKVKRKENGKYNRTPKSIVDDVAIKLRQFIKNNNLEWKKIEFGGTLTEEEFIVITYKFLDKKDDFSGVGDEMI